jgi:curved DNA-binding protein CbpA
MSRFNYYDLLEVSPHSQQHEITSAYKRAKLTYSGENSAIYTIFSEGEARDMLKLIEEAYSVLGNKALRTIYDEKISQTGIKAEDISYDKLALQSKLAVQDLSKPQPKPKPIAYTVDEGFEKEIKQCTVWNGQMLAKVRNYKGIPLDRLSAITKISSFYLNAVENEDRKNLPAPVFVRGYITQIAKVLGLDTKIVADGYMNNYNAKPAAPEA